MKILLKENVFDAALNRIRYLFKEFPTVIAGVSGGKDSTVIFNLTMRVARELGRLPLPVFWLDQEAEWTDTVNYCRWLMYQPDVKPLWFQMPMHLDNAASFTTKFLKCWDPQLEGMWAHPKDPISIKENTFGTDRFKELFTAIFSGLYPGQRVAIVAGVRCEESPSRLMGLTHDITYKWVTWGNKNTKTHITFYPIYDWKYTDVWHAIHTEKWPYNKIYDQYYRYGIPVHQMRVSNLHHETAVRSLFILQELDPPLYERLVARLPGVDTAGKFGREFYAHRLPFMFKDWCEYRDYLTEKLCGNDPKWQAGLIKMARQWDYLLEDAPKDRQRGAAAVVNSILCNDYTGTKTDNFRTHFLNKYRMDVADAFDWADNQMRRDQDPKTFKWFEHHFRNKGALWTDAAGAKWFQRRRYRYRLKGDTVFRELRTDVNQAPSS